jgi:RecB family endonuclease NucS
VDVYGIDRDGRLVIIEIKRKAAGKDAVVQLAKYVKAIDEMSEMSIRPILVAPSISKGTHKLLFTMGVEFRRVDPKQCAKILEADDKTEVERLSRWI